MKSGAKIFHQVRRGVQNVAYGNPLYQKILATGEVPDRLYFTLPDPWPGDAQAGLALISAQRSLFEKDSSLAVRNISTALRNLRAVGTDAARQMSVRVIQDWLQHHDNWDEAEWAPDVLGERIAGWIGTYEFYAAASDANFVADLTASLYRQWKHLARTVPPNLTGLASLQAIRGLIYGGLNFPEDDKALGHACDLLKRQLNTELHGDGGHIGRSPYDHLHILRHLVDLRNAFKAAGLDVPECIRMAIPAMVPIVKFYRHGDGGLALFHGGLEETNLLIDAVLSHAEAKGRVLQRLPETGFERLSAGRSLLIVDTGRPAPLGHDSVAHAGLLSFEFGHGKERLIVNCGAMNRAVGEWRKACAATAAHSTVTVEDTNACEIFPSGGLGVLPRVEAQRYAQDDMQGVEMMHDGYVSKFGITHQRILRLSGDGEELQGRDILAGSGGRSFTLRWHLHPSVQASLAQSGSAALLRTASGSGWRLRVENAELGLEPSMYCGTGIVRRSLQLKVNGRISGPQTTIVWTLTREKKA